MPVRRWPSRVLLEPETRRSLRRMLVLLAVLLAVTVLTVMGAALRGVVTDYALSAARDEVVVRVNRIVKDVMADEHFSGCLVDLEHDGGGKVSAVNANVSAINTLSAEVLSRAVAATEQGVVSVDIPLTNLLGSTLLMNRGPSITVHVTVLSSSSAGFRSEITSAGINQTRHQLFLQLDIHLSCLLPWRSVDTSVQTEILVSETVIVGQVPSSYMNLER